MQVDMEQLKQIREKLIYEIDAMYDWYWDWNDNKNEIIHELKNLVENIVK